MTTNTKNLFFCFLVEVSTRFHFYMKSNHTIFISVKYITLKLAFMKHSHFWGRLVRISNSHNGGMKQNLAKMFYKFHFIHNMNICENKQILRSVFWIAWFLEKMTLQAIKKVTPLNFYLPKPAKNYAVKQTFLKSFMFL